MGYFDAAHPTFLADPVTDRDHARGPADAAVTVVEYGDFACPYCREAYGLVKAMLARFPDVRFVFRANPRSHLFPAAEPAAEAAEAAAARGKFWEMHDRLFETQAAGHGREQLVAAARGLGIDAEAFAAELDQHVYRAAVRAQEVSGFHSHVLSTPTFFVNGVRFEDSPDRLVEAVALARRGVARPGRVFRPARVRSGDRRWQQHVSLGPHEILTDLPSDDGGGDAGPGPYDLLSAALGACTSMTVQWAASEHQIPLSRVDVQVTQSRTREGHLFRRSVTLSGPLNDEQRGVLERAAEACPLARTLGGRFKIETRIAQG